MTSIAAATTIATCITSIISIITSRRTLLDYLVRPLTDTLRRGLRES